MQRTKLKERAVYCTKRDRVNKLSSAYNLSARQIGSNNFFTGDGDKEEKQKIKNALKC